MTATSTCPNLLLEQSSRSGIILSTNNSDYNYNSNSNYYYDNDMDCQWNLTSSTKVELTFFTFNTELDVDYLYVYDGGSSSSPLIGSFSGTSLPSPITSSSTTLHVRFTSNTSVQRRGFRTSYRGKTHSYVFGLFFSPFCPRTPKLLFLYMCLASSYVQAKLWALKAVATKARSCSCSTASHCIFVI